jgi:hypothetical protein
MFVARWHAVDRGTPRWTCWSSLLVIVVAVVACTRLDVLGSEEGAWRFNAQSAAPVAIPQWLSADSLRHALGYEPADQVWGLTADLDRDGTTDYVFQYSLAVCGTNCQYAIVDGRSGRRLGLIGGTVLVVGDLFINGLPVIHTYGHSSAAAGHWSTLVYDGKGYVPVETVYLEGESLKHLFEGIGGIPYRQQDGSP